MYNTVNLSNNEAMFLLSDKGEDVGVGFDSTMFCSDLESLKGKNEFKLNMETDCICTSKNVAIIGDGITMTPVVFSKDLFNTKDLVFLLSDFYATAVSTNIDLFRIIVKDISDNRLTLIDIPMVISAIGVNREDLNKIANESLNIIIPEVKVFINSINDKTPKEGDGKSFSYQTFKREDIFKHKNKLTLLEINIKENTCVQTLVDRI